jgi:MPBQ/MSBQ methyltransferase
MTMIPRDWHPYRRLSRLAPPALCHPVPQPPTTGDSLESRINKRYDSGMYGELIDEYFGYSGFHNFGYWGPHTRNQREASENLVDRLLDLMPHKTGTILDVACGMGASTRHLLRHYKPGQVTGINISDKQLATCRRNAPDCRFINMNATDLKFADASFENILCVEAAFHFDTRERFLEEAYRVLEPRGYLALSDILLRPSFAAAVRDRVPEANLVPDVAQYRALYERRGFEDVRVIEARPQCWEAFKVQSIAFSWSRVLSGQAPASELRRVAAGLQKWDWAISNYLLVSARKPRRRTSDIHGRVRDRSRHGSDY